jgi:hypothetical protein
MFDPRAYGDDVARILALDGDGERLMPLVHANGGGNEARELVAAAKVAPLLRAGLYLYFDCWDEAHTVAQDIETPEGSYWHAIVHRQEPDASNAAYWFRQVGEHAIFPELLLRAAEIGIPTGARWDPIAFVQYCGSARPGSAEERKAQELQRAEWQLLFDWCARSD